jgi:hypothetical protein
MSPDRLAELRRQRALVAQHLAWIDAELTAAGAGRSPHAGTVSPSAPVAPGTPPENAPPADAELAAAEPAAEIDPAVALANARADEIIEKYRATEALDPLAAKRGCLVLFGAFMVLLGATVLAIYFFHYRQN